MKITGKCPKCGSTDVYTNEDRFKHSDRSYIATSLFGRASLTTCVCLSCGFMEDYLKNFPGRTGVFIREKWRKISS